MSEEIIVEEINPAKAEILFDYAQLIVTNYFKGLGLSLMDAATVIFFLMEIIRFQGAIDMRHFGVNLDIQEMLREAYGKDEG